MVLWAEGYQFITKLFAPSRARKLGRAVEAAAWSEDPCHHGRAYSYLAQTHPYTGGERSLHQIAVRCKPGEKSKAKRVKQAAAKATKTGKSQVADEYQYSVLIVSSDELAQVAKLEPAQLLSQLHFYDARATIESASIRGDKQGLKLVKRHPQAGTRQSLGGQEMLILLAQLAHNLIVWARGWLGSIEPKLAEYGIKRWVRDLLTMKGRLTFKAGQIVKVRLGRLQELARRFFAPLATFGSQLGVRLILDET